MKAIRLYLIQGTRLLGEALVSCLQERSHYRLIGTTRDPERAISELGSLEVDIVLIDATANFRAVHELILDLRDTSRQLKLLPLGVDTEEDAVRLLEAGADGYLLSVASFFDLLEVIRSVHEGQPACSPRVIATVWARVAALAEEKKRRRSLEGVVLTQREKDVLGLVAEGRRNKEIARRLNISLATVKNHVHRILDKLEVKGRHDAIRIAYENGLLDDPRLPSPGRPKNGRIRSTPDH